mgnify:CR=1 FL=1
MRERQTERRFERLLNRQTKRSVVGSTMSSLISFNKEMEQLDSSRRHPFDNVAFDTEHPLTGRSRMTGFEN